MTTKSVRKTQYRKIFEEGIENIDYMVEACRLGGTQLLNDRTLQANALTQSILGVDAANYKKTYNNLQPVQKKIIALKIQRANAQVAIDRVLAEINAITRLPTHTIQFFIISSLIAQFETYLEDVAFSVATIKLNLDKEKYADNKKVQNRQITRIDVRGWIENRFDEVVDNLAKNLKLPIKEVVQTSVISLTSIDQAIAIRNIYLHNNGKISKKFKGRTNNSNLKLGDYYTLEIDYLARVRDQLILFVNSFDVLVMDKYPEILNFVEEEI